MDKTRHNAAGPAPEKGGGPSNSPPPSVDRLPWPELSSIGGYRLLRWLGEGGMGSVYLGYQEGQGVPVALKVLGEHLVRSTGYVDRFHREWRNGASLDHPHIVHSY